MEESGSAASVPASFKDEYNCRAWHLVSLAILSAKNSLITITSERVVGLK